MKIIVQKYGGSSLATPDLISRIANNVISTKRRGYEIAVVVSALGDTTDHLVELSQKVAKNPPRREMDMLLCIANRYSRRTRICILKKYKVAVVGQPAWLAALSLNFSKREFFSGIKM